MSLGYIARPIYDHLVISKMKMLGKQGTSAEMYREKEQNILKYEYQILKSYILGK